MYLFMHVLMTTEDHCFYRQLLTIQCWRWFVFLEEQKSHSCTEFSLTLWLPGT